MKKINKKGLLAISQIMILIISIMAFSLVLGGQIGFVSAGTEPEDSIPCDGEIGVCLDSKKYDCISQNYFETGLCRGKSHIMCCKGTPSKKAPSVEQYESIFSLDPKKFPKDTGGKYGIVNKNRIELLDYSGSATGLYLLKEKGGWQGISREGTRGVLFDSSLAITKILDDEIKKWQDLNKNVGTTPPIANNPLSSSTSDGKPEDGEDTQTIPEVVKVLEEDTSIEDLEKELGDLSGLALIIPGVANVWDFAKLDVDDIDTLLDEDKLLAAGTQIVKGGAELETNGAGTPTKEKPPTTDTAVGDQLLKWGIIGERAANAVGHFAAGAVWAQGLKMSINQFGVLFPDADPDTVATVGDAVFWGAWAGRTSYGFFKKGGYLNKVMFKEGKKFLKFFNPAGAAITIGILVAVAHYMHNYEKEEIEIHTFTCEPWQAPVGGNKCEGCNDQGILPCTEYQCKSLGQSCELLNQGTGEEKCVWTNRDDVNPPEIKAAEDTLQEGYVYNPEILQFPNKQDRGVKIDYTLSDDKCIPAFTPLIFGITLDEPAKCKIDISRKSTYDAMSFSMSDSLSKYEHSYALSLPNTNALDGNITIENDGEFNLFVRCMDSNGNFNIGNFVFNFCVDQGPDTTPPLIIGSTVGTTTMQNTVPIRHNQSSIEMEIYVNEPAQCNWGHRDQNYGSLEETMDCPQISSVLDLQMAYACSAELTGLKDMYENEFFFRCIDGSGNENRES